MNSSNKSRRNFGFSLVLMGAFIFLAFGVFLERTSPNGSCDFETLLYPARFLVMHQDPYLRDADYRPLAADGYMNPNSATPAAKMVIFCVYPPTALLVTAPIALLRWHYAEFLWMSLLAGTMIAAALLIWRVASKDAPFLSGLLIGFTLANSSSLLLQGNAAGLAVGTAMIALILFLRRRLELLGVLLLAISICVKPHDGLFLWLFLFVAGEAMRRRALQTLFALLVLGASSILWISVVAPSWRQELTTNIALLSSTGSINDPGPTSSTNSVTNVAVNLQTVFAIFLNKPGFYNMASYFICSILFLWLSIVAVRKPGSSQGTWFGIAAVSALTMLPIYHRHHDARMLLLAVPACATLWAQNRVLGWTGSAITFAALAATGDIPRAVLQAVEHGHIFPITTISGKMQMVLFARPAPLAILTMAIFFLYMYGRGEDRPDLKSGFELSDPRSVDAVHKSTVH